MKLIVKIEACTSILSNQFQLNLKTRTVASSEADTTTEPFLKRTKYELEILTFSFPMVLLHCMHTCPSINIKWLL